MVTKKKNLYIQKTPINMRKMARLEAIIDGGKCGSEGIRDKVGKFGNQVLLYDLSRFEAPYWLMNNNPLHGFMKEIISQGDAELSDSEKKLVNDVSMLYSRIEKFKEDYSGLKDSSSKEKYLFKSAREFIELLKPFGQDPGGYFRVAHLLPFTEKNGRLIPPEIYRFGEH